MPYPILCLVGAHRNKQVEYTYNLLCLLTFDGEESGTIASGQGSMCGKHV